MNAPLRGRTRALAVTLLAATSVVTLGATSAFANDDAFTTRVAGGTRDETAVAASKMLYPDGHQDDVVIVNGYRPVDGLTASYLAGLEDAPILFSDTNALYDSTKDELKRLDAKTVWLVGGTTVLSSDLEKSLQDGGYTVHRYGGADRYATAAAVALAGQDDPDSGVYLPERVYVTNGYAQADSVLVSPVAWARRYPVLLTEQDGVPQATKDALDKLDVGYRTVVGGTAVISDDTAEALDATDRLGGADRQETAVKVADDAVAAEGFTYGNAGLVGGSNLNTIDALSASALAGDTGTPLLYTETKDSIGETTSAYIHAHSIALGGDRSQGFIFGGSDAVSDAAVAQANAAAR